MLIHHSPPACATPNAQKGARTHAGSGPSRVRRRLFLACLGDPISLATRNRLSLHRHPEVSLEVVEETLLILQESQYYFLLELVDAVPRWMFSVPNLLQGFDSSICDWKNKFSLFGKYHLFRIVSFRVDFRCVHRLQLLKVCDQYVTLPNSPRVQSVSEEQSR